MPSPGLQHKGLLHTVSYTAIRKTLNMTVLWFHPALCVVLCCNESSPLFEVLKHIQLQPPLQLQTSFKSSSESHAEANTCTSNAFARSNLRTTDLNGGFVSPGIKQQYFGLSSTASRWHQEEQAMGMQPLKRCRETVCSTEQQNGLQCYLPEMLAEALGWRLHLCPTNTISAHASLLNPRLSY